MKIVTRRDLATVAASRFLDLYYIPDRGWLRGEHDADIHARLTMSSGRADPAEIDAIIGNKSWTKLYCGECGQSDCERVVEIGKRETDDNIVMVCPTCINKLKEITSAWPEGGVSK